MKTEQTQIEGAKATDGKVNVIDSAWWSPNLQAFLNSRPHFRRIYFDPEHGIWWIGCVDVGGRFKAGAKLLAVLCNGSKTQTQSFSNKMCDRVEERTEQFWPCAKYFGRRMFPRWY